jgi:geranylgeranyl diphosphate synthase type II
MFTISEIQKLINSEIKKESTRFARSKPENLYSPIKYILDLGGKRIRPSLVLLSYNLFSDEIENALPVGLAIEVFHNFTLLHDDIMDNADIRRNKPTVHKKFSKNAAILSGDVMSFISFQYILKSKTNRYKELLKLISDTAIEVCEGQQLDMDFETRNDVSEAEYLEMIRLKTAVLIGCSLKSGALAANADEVTSNKLYNYGINMGLAFQLQDDFLDTFGNEKVFGKKIGSDILSNKKTYLLTKALELANPKQKSELFGWINNTGFDPAEKINAVQNIYHEIGIVSIVEKKIRGYFKMAMEHLNTATVEDKKTIQLRKLSDSMLKRKY